MGQTTPQRPALAKGSRCTIGATVLLVAVAGCQPSSTAFAPTSSKTAIDLRLTEEPYQSQDAMNERMAIVIPYLEKATGLRIAYKPAINYPHSHQMLRDGEVDAINIGVMGGYQLLHNNADVRPLAIQKRSFRSVLIANTRTFPGNAPGTNHKTPLQILRGQRVAFGSRSSGSSFMQPVLHMRSQRIGLRDLRACFHEPNTNHLAMMVADGSVDFAFVPSFSGDPLHAVSPKLRDAVTVVWMSDRGRNDFFAAAIHPKTSIKHHQLQQLQQALLALNANNPEHKRVLDTWGYLGFEQPSDAFPSALVNTVAEAHQSNEGLTTCQEL